MKINKPKLNLTIDIIMFFVMMAIAGIGFLIKYVLVAGFKRNEIYERDVELYYWGIDRHQWGTIHLTLSLVLLFLLLLHIVFHWKQVVFIFKSMVVVKTWRIFFASMFVGVSLLLVILPLLVNPEIQEGVFRHHNRNEKSNGFQKVERYPKNRVLHQTLIADFDSANGLTGHVAKQHTIQQTDKHTKQNEIEIFGYMTLTEVAVKYGIPVTELASCIHIPKGHNHEKLGRLRKQYGFHLNDLRTYIEQNKMQ